jgi:hypothetical protein
LVTTITCLPRALSPVDALDHAGNGGLADVEHAEGIEQEHVELVGDGIEIGGPDELRLWTRAGRRWRTAS